MAPAPQEELRRLADDLLACVVSADDAHAETGHAQRVAFDMQHIEQLVAAAGLVSPQARRAALHTAGAVDHARQRLAISRVAGHQEQVAQHAALREAVTVACTALRNLSAGQFASP